MKKYGPKKAYQIIMDYAAAGDELMATRIFGESRISFTRYMEALSKGRALRKQRGGET